MTYPVQGLGSIHPWALLLLLTPVERAPGYILGDKPAISLLHMSCEEMLPNGLRLLNLLGLQAPRASSDSPYCLSDHL